MGFTLKNKRFTKVTLNEYTKNSIYLDPEKAQDYFNYIQRNPTNLIEQKTVKSLFPKLENKTCLEIGCAGAIYGREMLNKRALQVDSIDYSSAMIKLAKKITKDTINYHLKDINHEFHLYKTYDFICASFVFHYSRNLSKTLKNIIKLINPKGILLFSVPNPEKHKKKENLLYLGHQKSPIKFYNHSEKEYLDILTPYGFVIDFEKKEDFIVVKFMKSE